MYAVDHGARIINLSFGGAGRRRSSANADPTTRSTTACSSSRPPGNEYGRGNPVEYPAALLQPVGSDGVGGAGLVGRRIDADRRAGLVLEHRLVRSRSPRPARTSSAPCPSLSPASMYPRVAAARLAERPLRLRRAAPRSPRREVAGAAALVWAREPAADRAAGGADPQADRVGRRPLDAGARLRRRSTSPPRSQRRRPASRASLLSGNRVRSKLHLTWSGDTSRYTLTLTTAGASRIVLSASPDTSAWVRLKPGRAYDVHRLRDRPERCDVARRRRR